MMVFALGDASIFSGGYKYIYVVRSYSVCLTVDEVIITAEHSYDEHHVRRSRAGGPFAATKDASNENLDRDIKTSLYFEEDQLGYFKGHQLEDLMLLKVISSLMFAIEFAPPWVSVVDSALKHLGNRIFGRSYKSSQKLSYALYSEETEGRRVQRDGGRADDPGRILQHRRLYVGAGMLGSAGCGFQDEEAPCLV